MISENSFGIPTLKHWVLLNTMPRAFMFRYSRLVMSTLLIIGDLLAICISAAIPVFLWTQIDPTLPVASYVQLYPLLGLFILLYAIGGLYPAMGISSMDLLKSQIVITTIGFLLLGTAIFYFRSAMEWSRGSFGVSWALTLILLPNMRIFVRQIASRLNIWGEPVVIFGYGEIGKRIAQNLKKQTTLGFQPVVAFEGNNFLRHNTMGLQLISAGTGDSDVSIDQFQTAILIEDEIDKDLLREILGRASLTFPRKILVSSSQTDFYSGALFQLGGVFGAEVRHRSQSFWMAPVKRAIDLCFVILVLPLWLVLIGGISLLIRLDSRGPIFFSQDRVGKKGKYFRIIKFRTMIENAQEILDEYLKKSPECQAEWEENFKLKSDPRITRIGRFLRKYSLDELPQIINIFKGEMSLIGPRPIVKEEIPFYGRNFASYTAVSPGLTGLWQTSGRNDLSYKERVNLDTFYVNNWSIWLDYDILLRTAWAILHGDGAY